MVFRQKYILFLACAVRKEEVDIRVDHPVPYKKCKNAWERIVGEVVIHFWFI